MSLADTTRPSGMDVGLAAPPRPLSCADADADTEVHVIAPRRSGFGVDLPQLWHYRELLYFLIWRDLKARYKQTVLGAAWAILRPVMTMVVLAAVFGRLAGLPSGDVPYPIFLYAALLPWSLFAGAVSSAGGSLVAQANLFTKVYFPRVFIPASCIGVVLVDFLLASGVYVGIMLWYMHLPGLSLLLLPVLIVILLVQALGFGLLLAAVTVTYRDFRSIIPFMMQTWMYLSPVVYSADSLSERSQGLLLLNPMTGVIDGFRSCLLNQPINWTSLAVAAVGAVVVFTFGLFYFGRAERRFADIA